MGTAATSANQIQTSNIFDDSDGNQKRKALPLFQLSKKVVDFLWAGKVCPPECQRKRKGRAALQVWSQKHQKQ